DFLEADLELDGPEQRKNESGLPSTTQGRPQMSCGRGLDRQTGLIIIRVGGRTPVVDEIVRTEWGLNLLEFMAMTLEVEAVGKIIGVSVGIAQRRQLVILFDEPQDAAKVMGHVRDIALVHPRRDDDERYPKTVHIAGAPTAAVVHHPGGDVVIPASPIIPGDEDDSIVPVITTPNGVHDGGYKRRALALVAPGMVRGSTGRDDPAYLRQLKVIDIGKDLVRGGNDILPIVAQTDVLNSVGTGPEVIRRRRVIRPADSSVVEQVSECGMLKAGVLLGRLVPIGIDQLHILPRWGSASCVAVG